MTRFTRWASVSSLLGVLSLGAVVGADEEKIPVDKLPAAVLKAVKAKYPKAKIEEAAREVEDGETTYEVELKDEGHELDVTLKADGTIVEVERTIAVEALPEAVRNAVAAKYPDAKIKKAEEITKGETGPVLYEVDLGSAEVVLDAKGKILKTEDDGDDDEADDKPKAAK